ncbi:MAG: protein phosphatase CheZ [Flavobacteriaceae bacterium]
MKLQGTSQDSRFADERPVGEHYDAILEAVKETARGRWFLEEFARRNRATDTDAVMTALSRVEAMLERQDEKADQQRIRTDLLDMIAVIARTRAEIAAMRPDADGNSSLSAATTELQLIVNTIERATSDILARAEEIQEVAAKLRAVGAAPALCDALDACATDIFTGCSFQDLTGQRIGKIVDIVEYLENRLNAMMTMWSDEGTTRTTPQVRWAEQTDAHLLNGPAALGEGIEQDEVDQLFQAPLPADEARADATDAVRQPKEAAEESDLSDPELFDIRAINPRLRPREADEDGAEPDVFERVTGGRTFDVAATGRADRRDAREAKLDRGWEEREISAGLPSSGREPVPDVDLSALTREQKQVLFS